MGSPGRNLNIPEPLRAWHAAGLHYLLRDPAASSGVVSSGAVVEVSGTTPATTGTARPSRPTPKAQSSDDHSAEPAPSSRGIASAHDSAHAAYGNDSLQGDRAEERAAAGVAGNLAQSLEPVSAPESDVAAHRPAEQSEQVAADDYRTWPEPWRSFWLKTPHDSRIVWTYFELGAHMGGKPDAEAAKLLQSLIYYFRWPKGTIAFWPMSELRGQDPAANAEMFWRGLDLLGVRDVAVFGSGVLSVVAPDAPAHAQVIKVENVTFHRLPALAALAPMLPHERLIALDGLKKLQF